MHSTISDEHITACLQVQVRQECEAFLRKSWPPSDASTLPQSYLDETVGLALDARRAHDWAEAVPWPLFLNYVLPYAR